MTPKSGPRLRAWMNYETFQDLVGNVKSLVEATFSSLKAMVEDMIYRESQKARICDAFVSVLAYNPARIITLSPY